MSHIVFTTHSRTIEDALQNAIGRYIGQGIAVIDSVLPENIYVGVIGHEAEHGNHANENYGALKSEHLAFKKEMEFLNEHHILKRIKS